ncbi:tetratricopeptide repeat protein [Paraburkholderia humisilvae]|uniref:Uncharacterized protein n=1 Tax=Paraburkholderia humisilvae TaxID=627669 RepID=A0A6J5F357_9BURK|nr:hypothetical protein [Paraburkholderia humisilvae]CAB3773260.1 hypothetical protein LMG29542_07166 [Paraburkholderia humisilvae]
MNSLNGLAWTKLALWWLRNDYPAAARAAAESALSHMPNSAVAWQNYSNVLRELREWDAALSAIRRACELDVHDDSMRWSLGTLQLMLGDYERGWPGHEARWQGEPELRAAPLNRKTPRWNGQPLSGKTLLVWSDQGYGDVLRFIRFLPAFARWVRQQGGDIVFSTPEPLLALLERRVASRVKQVVPMHAQETLAYDYQLPLGSLPLTLGVTVKDLPNYGAPYLIPDAAQVRAWRERCAGAGLKVGLVWSGSRFHHRNPYRSVPPYALARALGIVPGVHFFNLQVDARDDELAVLREGGLRLSDHKARLVTFDDTAACVQQLDLVITVCTSVAHVAGALGVPAWLLLDVNPHWMWMDGRRDSPWYHSARLYRQTSFRQWDPVLGQIAGDLIALMRPMRARGKASQEVSG